MRGSKTYAETKELQKTYLDGLNATMTGELPFSLMGRSVRSQPGDGSLSLGRMVVFIWAIMWGRTKVV